MRSSPKLSPSASLRTAIKRTAGGYVIMTGSALAIYTLTMRALLDLELKGAERGIASVVMILVAVLPFLITVRTGPFKFADLGLTLKGARGAVVEAVVFSPSILLVGLIGLKFPDCDRRPCIPGAFRLRIGSDLRASRNDRWNRFTILRNQYRGLCLVRANSRSGCAVRSSIDDQGVSLQLRSLSHGCRHPGLEPFLRRLPSTSERGYCSGNIHRRIVLGVVVSSPPFHRRCVSFAYHDRRNGLVWPGTRGHSSDSFSFPQIVVGNNGAVMSSSNRR